MARSVNVVLIQKEVFTFLVPTFDKTLIQCTWAISTAMNCAQKHGGQATQLPGEEQLPSGTRCHFSVLFCDVKEAVMKILLGNLGNTAEVKDLHQGSQIQIVPRFKYGLVK